MPSIYGVGRSPCGMPMEDPCASSWISASQDLSGTRHNISLADFDGSSVPSHFSQDPGSSTVAVMVVGW